MLKIPNVGSRTIVQAHANTTRTGMGSAALVAAVAYPKRQPEFLVEINEVLRRRRKKKDVWKKLWCLGDSDNCVCVLFLLLLPFLFIPCHATFSVSMIRGEHTYIYKYIYICYSASLGCVGDQQEVLGGPLCMAHLQNHSATQWVLLSYTLFFSLAAQMLYALCENALQGFCWICVLVYITIVLV